MYGCEMSPQIKQACSAGAISRRTSSDEKSTSKKLVRAIDLGVPCFSARELRKILRFPSVRLPSTTPFHLYFGKVFPNIGAPLFDCSSVASS